MSADAATWAAVGAILFVVLAHSVVTLVLAGMALRHGCSFRAALRIRSFASLGWTINAREESVGVDRSPPPAHRVGDSSAGSLFSQEDAIERTGGGRHGSREIRI